jgi:hypothetical protein
MPRDTGLYPGRTRHFHTKVQAAAESPVLTTQLYFPNEPRNRKDDLFRLELTMQVGASDDALRARFDLMLAMRQPNWPCICRRPNPRATSLLVVPSRKCCSHNLCEIAQLYRLTPQGGDRFGQRAAA